MRICTARGDDAIVGYCANVHPGETLADVLRVVAQPARGVREALGADALSLGLWLSRCCADELADRGCAGLARALEEAGIFVVTLNGFPYGNFHAEVVKRHVYHPDLCSDERRQYLTQLARVLSVLLPEDVDEGTISTVPIGHREEPLDVVVARSTDVRSQVDLSTKRRVASEAAARQLCRLVEDLARLRDETGKSIRVCLEPEPGCWLETTSDALQFFGEILPAVARAQGVAPALLSQHLGLCYDTCHQAIAFEDAQESIRALREAGVTIGKAQLSSAIELATLPARNAHSARTARTATDALELLSAFREPRFLHQVRTRAADGTLLGVDDLDEIDAIEALPMQHPLRVHYHVPIHRESVGDIATTRPFLLAALAELTAQAPVPQLEVETYTWTVLPEAERPKTEAELVRGLASEVAFVRDALR